MKKCSIFGSAEICDYSVVKIEPNCFVIAADGGADHLKRLGIEPNLAIGDFDSINGEIPHNCKVVTVPSQKDDTDLMLSVKTALKLGYDSIFMYGVLGGRLDHTYANIQMLEYIALHGGKGVLIGDNDEVMLQDGGTVRYPKREGCYFSFFSVTDRAEISVRGAKYTLDNYTLTRDFSLGVSNEITDAFAEIELKSGKIVVINSKKR